MYCHKLSYKIHNTQYTSYISLNIFITNSMYLSTYYVENEGRSFLTPYHIQYLLVIGDSVKGAQVVL